MTFQGLLTALVTPFRDGVLDEAAYRALVRRQLDAGVDGLVPCGTTGEAPTLTVEEHASVVRWAVEESAGQIPVLAGIGSNNTASAIACAQRVAALGVQGVLATAPYYNKPSQEGLYLHFRAIAEATPLEVCLYDVPSRTSVHVEPETVERLAAIDNVTCLKDATADMLNASEVLRRCGDGLAVLSGDDFTAFPLIALGGAGCVSVTSNVAPKRMKALIDAARAGDLQTARSLQSSLLPLFRSMFFETNPAPAKAALAAMGLIADELRLPLCPMGEATRARLHTTLRASGLIGD
jgi:4-hydroxy-tetrahydrodipicolinate synthase